MSKTATLIKDDGQICQVLIQHPRDYSQFITGGKGKVIHIVLDRKHVIIWDQDELMENFENLSTVKSNRIYPIIQGPILFLD